MKRISLLIIVVLSFSLFGPLSACISPSKAPETSELPKPIAVDPMEEYMSFLSTLPDEEFADYVLDTKLGITLPQELRNKFLYNPEPYKQEAFDYILDEISKLDSELANKLEMIPFLGEIELEDVEACEDVLYLASNPENLSRLEKLFGKGIERKMWPVALERLVYKGFSIEFDVDNPLEGQEWDIYSRLAEFQEKYNAEMDQEGVPGPKPAIRGMNYLHEPLGHYMGKTLHDLKFDYVLTRWALRCNAVRLYGYGDYDVFCHANLAQDEGLDVWLVFFPLFKYPEMDLESYKKQLSKFTEKAEENNVVGLYIGAEFDAWWRVWGGYDGMVTQYDIYSEEIKRYIDDLVGITRSNYSGPISYQEWDYWNKPEKNVNWTNMDVISLTSYIGSYINQTVTDDLCIYSFRGIKKKYNKPLFISELGSLTVSESQSMGGYAKNIPAAHYDTKAQAKTIERQLRITYQADVDATFIFCWDEPKDHPWGDMNQLGFGIWDHIKKEPKPSFWTVYKYFKE